MSCQIVRKNGKVVSNTCTNGNEGGQCRNIIGTGKKEEIGLRFGKDCVSQTPYGNAPYTMFTLGKNNMVDPSHLSQVFSPLTTGNMGVKCKDWQVVTNTENPQCRDSKAVLGLSTNQQVVNLFNGTSDMEQPVIFKTDSGSKAYNSAFCNTTSDCQVGGYTCISNKCVNNDGR
mgnify:CR=1 FL=1